MDVNPWIPTGLAGLFGALCWLCIHFKKPTLAFVLGLNGLVFSIDGCVASIAAGNRAAEAKAADAGAAAFKAGQPVEACPHARDSERAARWRAAWYAAKQAAEAAR